MCRTLCKASAGQSELLALAAGDGGAVRCAPVHSHRGPHRGRRLCAPCPRWVISALAPHLVHSHTVAESSTMFHQCASCVQYQSGIPEHWPGRLQPVVNTVLCPQIGDLQCCCWWSGTPLRSHTAIQSDISGWCRSSWLPPLSANALILRCVRRRPGAAAVHPQHHPGRHLGAPLRGQP